MKWGECPMCGMSRTRLFETPREWQMSPAVCLACWADRAAVDPENAAQARVYDELTSVLKIFRDVVLRNQGGQS